MTVRVILHGAYRDAMPKGSKRGITLHANTCHEVLDALEQHFPIKDMLNNTKGEIRLGQNYKRSKSLTAEQAGSWTIPDGATVHIGPHVTGHEITTAMLITAAISAAASIAATILINVLMPTGTSEQTLLLAPAWARVGLTAPSERIREAAAIELAQTIIGALEGSPPAHDARQMALPL